MCLSTTSVRPTNRWNWDGDSILPDTEIVARRRNPATSRRFPVDIREFVSVGPNTIVHKALDRAASGAAPRDRARFHARSPGSFDARVRAITRFVAETVHYAPRGRAARDWLFPDECLDAQRGDCEDLAFLLANLLLTAGISGYVVRVALGRVREHGGRLSHEHAWVMYRDEGGHWLLLDPLIYTPTAGEAKPRASLRRRECEYEPRYVFNDQHLWAVGPARGVSPIAEYVEARNAISALDPTFAASIHGKLYDTALANMSWAQRSWVKSVSLAADADIFSYHPFDHFDNGYIEQGWQRVRERLATGELTDFARATHAVADFYAHSSYAHFAIDASGALSPVDESTAGAGPAVGVMPAYDVAPFDFARFSRNNHKSSWTAARSAREWSGRWISGRYAQPSDPSQGFFERLTPYPDALETKDEFDRHGALPHHNEIAVDDSSGGSLPKGHKLYTKVADYDRQFDARSKAATQHVARIYADWSAKGFDA